MAGEHDRAVAPEEINYRYIVEAVEHYRGLGYRLIQVPWIVSAQVDDITRPLIRRPIESFLGRHVASAESSFLELIRQGKLPPGRYQAVTPCFRDEDVLDDTHKQWFMKVELIDTEQCDASRLLRDAQAFFSRYLAVDIQDFDDGSQDLVSKPHGIELGSYGIRHHSTVGRWAYGTGLAEPRMSYCIARCSGAHDHDLE